MGQYRKEVCSQRKGTKFLESCAKIPQKSPIMELRQCLSILSNGNEYSLSDYPKNSETSTGSYLNPVL
jgi:hypothetical protein